MLIKTYAARGLLEWQTLIPTGGAVLRLHFKGGTMGTNGILPAKFTTGDPVVQRLIESSRQFQTGKIFLYGQPQVIPDETDSKAKQTLIDETEFERDCQENGFDFRGDSDDYV